MKRIKLPSFAFMLFSALYPSVSFATPTFTILNRSGLSSKEAKFYYLGYGQLGNNFVILMPDGNWEAAGTAETGWLNTAYNPNTQKFQGAGVIPCYQVTSNQKITIPDNIAGARVYFFQVRSTNPLFNRPCQSSPNGVKNSKSVNGIFGNVLVPGTRGQAPFSYFSSKGNGLLTGASIDNLTNSNLPTWTYSEIGAGKSSGTIDTSQVDFIGFPMNVTTKLGANPALSHPISTSGVGFSFSSSSQVNMQSILESFTTFAKTLPTQTRADYLPLRSTIGGGAIFNPGNYIAFINKNAFQNFFLNIVNNYMWKPGWVGTINDGGKFGSLPQLGFAGTALKLTSYPGYKGKEPLFAIKFSADIKNGKTTDTVVAYVLSPASYKILCSANAINECEATTSPAYQIFATAGALTTPTDNSQFALLNKVEQGVWQKYGGVDNYNAVVSRLGFIISMAYNHGVAGALSTTTGLCPTKAYREISACWSNQKFWYPTDVNPELKDRKTLFFGGDITGNDFSRWLHTAAIQGVRMMAVPQSPAVSQFAGEMGMGYGFAADENPTPAPVRWGQTPSKYDGNVSMSPSSNCNWITIMPWSGGLKNISPVGKDCGP